MVGISIIKLTDDVRFPWDLMYLLSDEKRIKITNFKNISDKKRGLAGELLIRKAATNALNINARDFKISLNLYGKPYIENSRHFKFNISHSGSYVVIATSIDDIGVDIELIKPIDLHIAERFFTKNEYAYIKKQQSNRDRVAAFYKLWTLKESYIKAVGKGLAIPLNSFEFDLENTIRIINEKKQKHFFYATNFEDYFLAACYTERNIDYMIKLYNEQDIYDEMRK